MGFLGAILIGALAGWLGSLIYRGKGFGILGDIVLGIVGSVVGFWLLGKLGVNLGDGLIGTILTSVIGSIVVLVVVNLIFQNKEKRQKSKVQRSKMSD